MPISTNLFFKRSFFLPFFIPVLMFGLAAQATAITAYTWNNPGVGDWSDAANWVPAGVPGTGDQVTLDNGGTINLDLPFVEIGELNLVDGTFAGAGDMAVQGFFSWKTGSITGSGMVESAVELYFEDNAARTLDGKILLLTGPGYFLEGNLHITGNGVLRAYTTPFVLDNNSGASAITGGSAGTLEITAGGELIKTGSEPFDIGCNLVTSGASRIEIDLGDLVLNCLNGQFSSTMIDIWADGLLKLQSGNYDFEEDNSIGGSGILQVAGAVLSFNQAQEIACTIHLQDGEIGGPADVTVNQGVGFEWTGGSIAMAANLNMDGNLSITGAATKTLESGTFNLASDAFWSAGDVHLADGAVFRITPIGKLYATHSGTQTIGGTTTGELQVEGEFTKNSNATTVYSGIMDMSGAVTVNMGTLKAGGSSSTTSSGIFNLASGAIYNITGGSHAFSGGMNPQAGSTGKLVVDNGTAIFGNGSSLNVDIELSGGELTANVALTPRHISILGGTLNGTGNLTANGDLTWSNGTLSGAGTLAIKGQTEFVTGMRYLNGKKLRLEGDGHWSAGDFTFSNGAVLEVAGTSVLSIDHGSTCTISGTGSLNVLGDAMVHNMNSSISFGAGIVCTNSGIIDGNGTLGFENTMNYNTIRPGFSTGKLTLADFNNMSGTLDMEIQSLSSPAQPGSDFDQLEVTGSGVLSGTIKVSLLAGFVPAVGDRFLLVDCADCTGTFSVVDLTNAALPSDRFWGEDYSAGFELVVFSVLPVTLTDFWLQPIGTEQVLVHWATEAEADMVGYRIERSRDGIRWEAIGFEPTAGLVQGEGHYSFSDFTKEPAIYYYRLRLEELDGSFTYSPTKSISMVGRHTVGLEAAPNPVGIGGEVRLVFPDGGELPWNVQVTNMNGQKVFEIKALRPDLGFLSIPGHVLGKGIFEVVFSNGANQPHRLKLVVE